MSRICFYVGLLAVALSFIKAEARSQNCNVLKSQLDALGDTCTLLRASYWDFLDDCRSNRCDGKLCIQLQDECGYLTEQSDLCENGSQDKHIDCSSINARRDAVCKDSEQECKASKDCYSNFCLMSEEACNRSWAWGDCQEEYRILDEQYRECRHSERVKATAQTKAQKFIK
jgi:hypothetical protein